MNRPVRQHAEITAAEAGRRLDQVLAERWPDYSRTRLTAWIRAGDLSVDGRPVKPRHRVSAGERVVLDTELTAHPDTPAPQAIALDILHADDALLIVNKSPGLVVHPGSGNPDGTLVNGLLHHDPDLEALPRAGLVHRLDKDTSGCLVVARTPASHRFLVAAMKKRRIKRHYKALVWGDLVVGGRVDEPLGRHPVDRRRQTVRPDGRRAVTHYRVAERLAGATLLDVELETGRTHQIRVHLSHIRHPIVGDPTYGRSGAPAGLDERQREAWRSFPRQALHAARIAVPHPDDESTVTVEAPLPTDFAELIRCLDRAGD
jgi:23S rRNA pseudouridine1911/1915/1917 synthase